METSKKNKPHPPLQLPHPFLQGELLVNVILQNIVPY